jgi:transposase
MSTSIIYHAWGIYGYTFRKVNFQDGAMIFQIAHKAKSLRCSVCQSTSVIGRGTSTRRFRSLPVGSRPVFFELAVQRVECLDCKSIRQVKLSFAEPRVSYTKRFERYALELLQRMTIQDVARHLGISWDVIKEIQKSDLEKRFSKPSLKSLKRLAIDEIAVAKGHKYLRVVMDLDTGAVIFVGDTKGHEALDPFWKILGRNKANIEAVATDMGRGYLYAVRQNLPNAIHVLDHFHVVKAFNDKLSALRRELFREAKDQLQKDVLKGTRWILLKNQENLDAAKNEKERLEQAISLNKPLAVAYYMKEELRTFWQQANKIEAKKLVNEWVAKAVSSGGSQNIRKNFTDE